MNGSVTIGGPEQSGSELVIAANHVTDVDASRSIIVFASTVNVTEMRSAVTIRHNSVALWRAFPLNSTHPPAAFVSARGIVVNSSVRNSSQHLAVTENAVEMMALGGVGQGDVGPVFVFVEAAECQRRPSTTGSECNLAVNGNVIRQTTSASEHFNSIVTLSSILSFTAVTLTNNTVHTAGALSILEIGTASVAALVICRNKVTYTSPPP